MNFFGRAKNYFNSLGESVITINGKSYNSSSITIKNNQVIVNGKEIDMEKALTVVIEGNVESLKADVCKQITVKGSVDQLSTMDGDVTCGDVLGSVSTMSGDIEAKSIKGSVQTMSGDIRSGS